MENTNDTNNISSPKIPDVQLPKMNNIQKPKISVEKGLFAALAISVLVIIFLAFYISNVFKGAGKPQLPSGSSQNQISKDTKVEKFKSAEEFKKYLSDSEGLLSSAVSGGFSGLGAQRLQTFEARDFAADELSVDAPMGLGGAPERISETNVQVKGIDEPDIVKTDGMSIFFSSSFGGIRPLREMPIEVDVLEEQTIGIMPPDYNRPETKVIKAFPPSDLDKTSSIEQTGDLLLAGNNLVVFSGNYIFGYDVSDKENPLQSWKFELESRNQIVSSRLYKNNIYVVAQTRVNSSRPCPIPLSLGVRGITIPCNQIYHPVRNIPVDATFTAFVLNPATGTVSNKVTFVGSSGQTVVYMSTNTIYITYTYYESLLDFIYNFFVEEGQDLLPQSVLSRLGELKNYEISEQSKMNEFGIIFEEHISSLTDDERLRIENEMTNRLDDYVKENGRNLETSGIVKVSLDGLKVEATGGVPGRPLNQFSLDEYQGNLRIATTVSESVFGTRQSANDVYVLDSRMQIIGSVLDMGLTERIYSARFIEDKGYIVTFRRIDPFYVLDLSDPTNPQLKGELKIPGYSSYLHPITKDKILGVGMEGSKVKISLFDVTSPSNPLEADKYMLDEYWTDISSTHHAFLLDDKHKIFFIPASKGGYIFSYSGDKLKLVKAVSSINARRAIYLNDYLYIIGDDQIVVLNEVDWEEVNSLDF